MPVIVPPSFDQQVLNEQKTPLLRFKKWMDEISIFSQTITQSGSPEGVVSARRAQKYIDIEKSGASYFKSIDGGKDGWYELDRVPENVKCVFDLSDLPKAINNIIQLEDDTGYTFKLKVLDVGNNQIIQGSNTWMDGAHDGLTEIKGNTEGPLFQTNGTSGFKAFNLTLNQEGSGDLILLDSSTAGSSFKLLDCEVIGGNIRLVNGLIFIANELLVDENVQIIQEASGFLPTIIFNNIAVLFGLPVSPFGVDGIILFETGSLTNSFRYIDSDTVMLNGGTAIKIETGAIINEFLLRQGALQSFIPFGNTQIKVENPNNIVIGTIENTSVSITSADRFLACEPVSEETVTATDTTTPTGVTQDGLGNIIVSDPGTNTIVRYEGFTDVVDVTITAPDTDVGPLAWLAGDLFSIDTLSGVVYKHQGFTGATSSVASPLSNPTVIAFAGTQMLLCNATTFAFCDVVYNVFGSLVSITIVSSFTSPTTNTFGIAYDGVNVLLGDLITNEVFLLASISESTQYSFSTPATAQKDIWVTFDFTLLGVGFVAIDETAKTFILYDHPVTFDRSSSSWEFTNISGAGVPDSSDRGGVGFTSTEFPTMNTLVPDEWTPISNSDTLDSIKYSTFSETEKMVLSNESTGEIAWLSTRERGMAISTQVTIRRSNSGGTANYEIAYEIDGVLIEDSIVFGAIASQNVILPMTTLPISRELTKGRKVRPVIRALSSGTIDTPGIGFSKVSIT